jgi:H+-transporting ATPase
MAIEILNLKFETLSIEETFKRLECDTKGISQEEAARRLLQFGPNAIEEKKVHPALKFLSYFWGPIPWMIEIAAILSAVVHDWPDFGIIMVLLTVNAIIGFEQEYKADNAIALLKQKLALIALVLRDSAWEKVEAAKLVPGDIVRVKLGDIVPADLKLTDGNYLELDQSALTGESLPVEKHPGDIAYSGTIVDRGEMEGVVVGTGMHTYFGSTARLVQETQTVSHYQKAVLRIGHFLILMTLALVSLILLVAMFRHTPMLETVTFALILTVAAIPVALPAVLSVTMAVGSVKLARLNAIVSRLVSIEEMAGMDILCSDKTGTLTQNRLEVGDPVVFSSGSPDDILRFAALASKQGSRDAIDIAILRKLDEKGLKNEGTIENYEPFDPVIKRSEATVHDGIRQFKVSKGAPQVILELCADKNDIESTVQETVNALAGRGYRALGVAKTTEDGSWSFLGVLPLYDPPREDSASMIEEARKMGVSVKMITGDHHSIARETSKQLHLGENIATANDLNSKDGADLETLVEDSDGFAQVFPEHKHQIVKLLQKRGHIVGMTGDGVNDAPALKQADIGIAVSGATDAARSAADLVLTSTGLSVIISGVEEARKIFSRMKSYAIYRIAETIRVLLFMTAAILIFDFYPVTAGMIIILALLNDLPIMMIAYDNAEVDPKPVVWDMYQVLNLSVVLGIAGVFSSFLMFWIGEEVLLLDRPTIQTVMFLKLTVAGHMTLYIARRGPHPFWTRPFPSAKLFWTSELTKVVATLFAVYGVFMQPIGWKLALLVWGYAFLWLLFNDFLKIQVYRLCAHRGEKENRHIRRYVGRLGPPNPNAE